jgi:hypothetical protein
VRGHELWHVFVLASTLFGAAGAALLSLGPLIFESPPPGLARARPLLIGAIVLAVAVFATEWLVVH